MGSCVSACAGVHHQATYFEVLGELDDVLERGERGSGGLQERARESWLAYV